VLKLRRVSGKAERRHPGSESVGIVRSDWLLNSGVGVVSQTTMAICPWNNSASRPQFLLR